MGSMNNATFMYDGNAAMSESTANYKAKHSSDELQKLIRKMRRWLMWKPGESQLQTQ
jgi:hypothetical protein